MSERIVRVGRRYTIVIPKKMRKTMGIREGDLLEARIVEEGILLRKLEENPFEVLKRVIAQPYEESVDEKLAERWLKDASSGHRGSFRSEPAG